MSRAQRIATGRRDDFYCLGVNDRDLFEWHPQIFQVLERMLGAEYVGLFAEAAYDQELGTLDWYASRSGEVRAWSELSAEEQQRLQTEIRQQLQSILDLASRIRGESNPGNERVAELLEKSVAFPSLEQIYLVGGSPVITFWGFSDSAAGANTALVAMATDAVVPPPTAPEVQPGVAGVVVVDELATERVSWRLLPLLWQVGGLLLLLALLLVLLRACAPTLPGALGGNGVGLAQLDEQHKALKQRKQDLEQDLQARLEQCQQGDRFVPEALLVQPDGSFKQFLPGMPLPGMGGMLDPVAPSDLAPGGEPPAGEMAGEMPGEMPGEQNGQMPEEALPMPNEQPPQEESPLPQPPGEAPGEAPGEEPTLPEEALPMPLDPEAQESAPQEGQTPPAQTPDTGQGEPGLAAPPGTSSPPGTSQPGAQSPGETPGAGDKLSVPDEAQPGESADFLEGDWESSTELKQRDGRSERVQIVLDFEGNGSGNIQLIEADGTRCQAPASGHVVGRGQVYIKTINPPQCSDGSTYQAMEITCENAAQGGRGSTCWASQEDGNRFRVELRRRN